MTFQNLIKAVKHALNPPAGKQQDISGSVAGGNITQHIGDVYHFYNGKADSESLLRRYLAEVAAESNLLPWANLDPDHSDPKRGEALRLADIYTALDTTELERPDTEDQVRWHLETQKESLRVSAQDMIDREPRLVLLGDPGSGKSTLVNFLSFIMSRADSENPDQWLTRLQETGEWRHGWLLPIRIILRDFAAGLDASAPGKSGLLLAHLRQRLTDYGLEDLWPVFHDNLVSDTRKKPFLILLDGLDKVPTALRKIVADSIDAFVGRYAAHRYVVTCRIYAYIGQNCQLAGFKPATLTPFNKDQIKKFIGAWYHELHLRRRFSQKDADFRAEQLKTAAMRPDLVGLAERPLLLTVMALLHTFRGQLPDDRVELYQWSVDLLLRRWESRVGGEKGLLETLNIPGLKTSDLEAGLYDVAFHVHAGGGAVQGPADIKEGDLRERLAPYLAGDWEKAGQFVNYVRERAGLLVRHKPDAYVFPHRTFQEFMAACHLTMKRNYPSKSAQLVKEDPNTWRIVYVLAAGHAARTHRLDFAVAAINALCPVSVNEAEKPDAAMFANAEIAGEALLEIGLVGVNRDELGKITLLRVRNWLKAAMTAPAVLNPLARVSAGNLLSQLGDPRFDAKHWQLPDDENLGFVKIPAGTFLMGSDTGRDPDAEDREMPQHALELPEYHIGKYPVTVAQYRIFAQETRQELDEGWRSFNKIDNHPVVKVSWHDATAYCAWLTGKLKDRNWTITLPTEAQWEKAARGEDGRIYPYGDDTDTEKMNCRETGIATTSPVGCFPTGESPYGCLDMSGNVFEWTNSLWGDDFKYPYVANDGRKDMTGGSDRVLRGGSWRGYARYCRSADRRWGGPGSRYFRDGFRLVCLPGQ